MIANTDQSGLDQLLLNLWNDFCHLNPKARKIFELLSKEGEVVQNDHIAFRTFQHPALGIQHIAKHFEKYGYKSCGEYFFKEKKLYALHFEHTNPAMPKIFISELELRKISPELKSQIESLVATLPKDFSNSEAHFISGRPWTISHQQYLKMSAESEYAGWVAAHGFRTNHFTVLTNELKRFKTLASMNEFIASHGYQLNSAGGMIKGTPAEYLEQSSTMAEKIKVTFSD
ncbi:MAG: DUF1338 domain-containing protein, partial [Pseudobdellovibrionaceae bacterium]